MLILSYENEFNLHVKEISFSYERMSTKPRFEEEATGNSEMAYFLGVPSDLLRSSHAIVSCLRTEERWRDEGLERLRRRYSVCLGCWSFAN